ncbi:MAG TPA: hypothetical protein VMJ31_03000 [Methylocystis sp.]|nr:hypothetical protein [Methylocystis sp.]
MLVLEPQPAMPEITPNGMMRYAGFFPSAPAQLNFEPLYAPVAEQKKPKGEKP